MSKDHNAAPVVLEVQDLVTTLSNRNGEARVVDGVSFTLAAGETLGVVGESGSGKTMLGMSLLQLLPKAARISGGSIRLDGREITGLAPSAIRALRGAEIGLIPQDPMVSLDPLFRVGNQISETLRAHGRLSRRDADARAVELLAGVNIPDAARRARSYPFEMSGGMRQRVVGAIGVACAPKVLIADEPTTALDVTVQAQYLQLLRRLQQESGVALILITHDFNVVAQSCDRVVVMYAGRIIEEAPVGRLFDAPAHPYSRALMDAGAAHADGSGGRRFPAIPGEPVPLFNRGPGCAFAPRCPRAGALCATTAPPAVRSMDGSHMVRCHHPIEGGQP